MKRMANLLRGKKPKALPGGVGKKERQRYKSAKGMKRASGLPDLAEMYKGIKGKGKNDGHRYFLRTLFTKNERERLRRLGFGISNYTFEPPALEHEEGRARMTGDAKVLMKKMILLEKHVNKTAFSPEAIGFHPVESAEVRHEYGNLAARVVGHIDIITNAIRERES